MATIEQVYDILQQIQQEIVNLPVNTMISPNQVYIVNGLSDIDGNLGLVVAGEFRAGNNKEPNTGFSGLRMAYPGIRYPIYNSTDATWHLAGVNNDTLQVGINALDGKFYAANGALIIDGENGITFSGDTNLDPYSKVIRWMGADASTMFTIGMMYSNFDTDYNYLTIFANIDSAAPGSAAELSLGALNSVTSAEARVNVVASTSGHIELSAPRSFVSGVLDMSGNIIEDVDDIIVSGDYKAIRGGTTYTGHVYVPLTTPLTSADWDGDARSTTAKTLIDLSAVFGVPDGVKAISVTIQCRDSDSLNSASNFRISPNDTAMQAPIVANARGNPNDIYEIEAGTCPCDSNGDIYYQTVASGAGTLDCIIEIWGYWV